MDGTAKKTNGSHIMKCIEVSSAFILYCNGEPLKIFKERGGILIHNIHSFL